MRNALHTRMRSVTWAGFVAGLFGRREATPGSNGGTRRAFCLGGAALLALPATAQGKPVMKKRPINPTATGWAQAHEVSGASRILFVSGQVPEADGDVPKDCKAQCRLAWRNVETQLKAAGMTLDHLAKITIYLADRRYIQDAYEVRAEVLPKHVQPAMTILISGIYDAAWLLEIEAIAVA